MALALLFPGQAAQFVGMGSKLSSRSDTARKILNDSDDILGYKLSEIMELGPDEKLKETVYTQPAVFVHSYMVYQDQYEGQGIGAVAGHSLGEITAAVVAGVMSFEDGLKLVQKRAESMQMACDANKGTMAAILGLEDSIVEEICNGIEDVVVAANYNCPGQLVISGSQLGIDKAIEKCKAAEARRALEIPVGGAFHSPLMDPAVSVFAEAIEGMHLQDARFPIYQNISAQKTTDSDTIKKNLIGQITSPVRWTQSMNNMIADGISTYVEVGGKGKVLMGMMRKISREVEMSMWQEV